MRRPRRGGGVKGVWAAASRCEPSPPISRIFEDAWFRGTPAASDQRTARDRLRESLAAAARCNRPSQRLRARAAQICRLWVWTRVFTLAHAKGAEVCVDRVKEIEESKGPNTATEFTARVASEQAPAPAQTQAAAEVSPPKARETP